MLRPALFIAVGVGFGVLWLHSLTGPDNQDPVSVSDWFATLGFSVALIGLAAALPVFGRLFGEPVVFRVSLVPAVGAALGGVANLLETACSSTGPSGSSCWARGSRCLASPRSPS